MNSAGRPDVNVVSKFSPGMPASVAGVVPKSNGSTLTLYWNQPKRKSASSVDESVLVHAERQALVLDVRHAAKADQFRAAALAERGRPVAEELAVAVAPEDVGRLVQPVVDRVRRTDRRRTSRCPTTWKLSRVPFSRPGRFGSGIRFEDVQRLRRQPAAGNHRARKLRARGRVAAARRDRRC